jgi:DNA-binding LacI/PurR family transcriptional regulator
MNRAASTLVTGEGRVFGILVPDLRHAAFAALARGAAERARQDGHLLAIADWSHDEAGEAGVARDLARRTDGLLLCASSLADQEARALATLAPVTSIQCRFHSLPAVLTNEKGSTLKALAYLRRLGHRQVAVTSTLADRAETQRHNAIRGHEEIEATVLPARDASFSTGHALAATVATMAVSAVLTFDDELALGIIAGLQDGSRRVPGDVSVLAACDSVAPRVCRPTLTTVSVRLDAMGATGLDLLARCAGATYDLAALRTIRLEPRLEIRGSTGPHAASPAP